MSGTMSPTQARRIFLHAQCLARSRPSGRVRDEHFARYLAFQGVLQLDTVNVFARAHYMPLFSRFGAYDLDRLDAWLWGAPDGHSPHTFEHWGHEASVMPRELLAALHHRMVTPSSWQAKARTWLEAERPGLLDEVARRVEDSGPVTAGELEHLAPRERPRGTWWDSSHVKVALDHHFITGRLAASRGRHFARTYDDTRRAWGREHAPASWGLPPDDARQQLFERALAAQGIGTPRDIADHFRLIAPRAWKTADAAAAAQRCVDKGLAAWVEVEGWGEPALLAVGEASEEAPWHRPGHDPGRATGTALLSPFDPVAWFRPRLARMFAVDYRIEIYTPAPQRQYGYYCLLFLLGDQIAARVDLKADRKAKVLRVEAAWREQTAPGARRRPDGEVADALAAELWRAAAWLGLQDVRTSDRGTLAATLADAVARAGAPS